MRFWGWTLFGGLILTYLVLAVVSPYMVRFNTSFRNVIARTRPIHLRPLMIMTHRYNDVLSLSLQIIVLALLIGYVWNDWRRAMIVTTAMFVQTTAVTATKQLAAVTRPPQEITHVIMRSGSYPSGHSAASMTFALLVPAVLAPYLAPAIIGLLATYLFLMALLTAYGRLFLDVHWLTDILGAWLISAAVYVLSRLLFRL